MLLKVEKIAYWVKVFHLFALFESFFGTYYFAYFIVYPKSFKMDEPAFVPLEGKMRFMASWNMVVQIIYFLVALLDDLIDSNENVLTKVPIIRKVKDYFFSSVAFPIAMYSSISFWILMAINRELVFPKAVDEFFPSWLNHLMHTNIMIFVILEALLTYRRYPNKILGVFGLALFLLAYVIFLHAIYFTSGRWVYQVVEMFSWLMRMVVYLVSFIMSVIFYFLGELINNKLGVVNLSAKDLMSEEYQISQI